MPLQRNRQELISLCAAILTTNLLALEQETLPMWIEWLCLIAFTLGIGYIPTALLCIREIKKKDGRYCQAMEELG